MTILRDFSVLWALIFRLIMIYLLFESRFPKKKTITLFCYTLLPLTILNIFVFIQTGPQFYMTLLLLTLTLPSLVILGFLSKNIDGRFLFTLCFVDTVVIEIVDITNILEYYIPSDGYFFMFLSRFITYPILTWIVYKHIRPIYLDVQQKVTKGWHIFAATAFIFYVVISLSMSYPTMITERPLQLPALILLFLLMPIVYFSFFKMLRHQQLMHEISEQENILRIQVANMAERIKEITSASECFRIERHDLRHKTQTIMALLEAERYDELRIFLKEYNSAIDSTEIKHYCSNIIMDTVLASYLQRAEHLGITVKTKITFPDVLPVPESELSTVFANAIENAIHACEQLPEKLRLITIKVQTFPRFMLQIANSYQGVITFDQNNLPIAHQAGHGFGTRSIAAFCNKHGAFYEFRTKGNSFILQIIFN